VVRTFRCSTFHNKPAVALYNERDKGQSQPQPFCSARKVGFENALLVLLSELITQHFTCSVILSDRRERGPAQVEQHILQSYRLTTIKRALTYTITQRAKHTL
jgi:hypothetical protein